MRILECILYIIRNTLYYFPFFDGTASQSIRSEMSFKSNSGLFLKISVTDSWLFKKKPKMMSTFDMELILRNFRYYIFFNNYYLWLLVEAKWWSFWTRRVIVLYSSYSRENQGVYERRDLFIDFTYFPRFYFKCWIIRINNIYLL